MKKFLNIVGLHCVLIILFMFLLDEIYTYCYQTGTPRNKVAYILSEENKKYDYIFVGSSRVENSIDPAVITEVTNKTAINYGIQGALTNDYFIILQLLNKQKIKAEVVFIQIDYNYNREGSSEILNSYLMPYLDDELVSSIIEEKNPDYSKLKHIPFYRYMKNDYKLGFREVFKTIIGNKPKLELKSGYAPLLVNMPGELKGSMPRFIIEENKTIAEINKFAKENNIEIVYFIAPSCKNVENIDFVNKLKTKIPGLIDYSRAFTGDEDYFYNCGHLNDQGAQAFSKLFAKNLLNNKP